MILYSGLRDDFLEEVVFYQIFVVRGQLLRNRKVNGFYQRWVGIEGKGVGVMRQVVKVGRDLKIILNLELDNVFKILVCVWYYL